MDDVVRLSEMLLVALPWIYLVIRRWVVSPDRNSDR